MIVENTRTRTHVGRAARVEIRGRPPLGCKPEVRDDNTFAAIFAENILRLDIAMENALLMAAIHGVDELKEDAANSLILPLVLLVLNRTEQVAFFEVLRHNIHHSMLFILDVSEYFEDVRAVFGAVGVIVDFRPDRLLLERGHLGCGHALHGEALSCVLHRRGEIHDSPGAATDALDEA